MEATLTTEGAGLTEATKAETKVQWGITEGGRRTTEAEGLLEEGRTSTGAGSKGGSPTGTATGSRASPAEASEGATVEALTEEATVEADRTGTTTGTTEGNKACGCKLTPLCLWRR